MKRINKILLALALLLAAQNAWAAATTKTVTYTITSISNGDNGEQITFTPSSSGFGTSTGTKVATISNPQNTNGFEVQLDDGVTLSLSRDNGSMTFVHNSNSTLYGISLNPNGDQHVKFTVACTDYYITHVKLAQLDGTTLKGTGNPAPTSSGSLDLDVDIDKATYNHSDYQAWVTANTDFGQLTITLSDTPRPFTITYVDAVNGQHYVTNDNPILYNVATPTFQITAPTRTGYTFEGFYDNAELSGSPVTLPLTITRGEAATQKDRTFYAQWTANDYTVTLDDQGATTAGSTEVAATFNSAMPAITVPAKTDYVFYGYYTEANGSGTKYYNADGTSAHTWDIASATTLYAQWVPSFVKYIDENGFEQTCSDFTIIQSSVGGQVLGDSNNNEAWYAVIGNVTVEGTLEFNNQAVNLILCDGSTLTITTDSHSGIINGGDNEHFTIYGQSGGTGTVSVTSKDEGIYGNYVTINGGNIHVTGNYYGFNTFKTTINGGIVSADGLVCISGDVDGVTINGGSVTATTGDYGISSGNIIINGGNVTAAGRFDGIYAIDNVIINGGNVAATGDQFGINANYSHILLGWTNITDSITASSYNSNSQITPGQHFIDNDGKTYSGPINADKLKGKTLRPYLSPNGGTPITLVQGTKDGVTAWWGTFCNSTYNFVLSEGAAAYTMGSDYKLYRLGTDGRTIPMNTAVVIIATKATPVSPATSPATATIQCYRVCNGTMTVTDHAPGGNILQGSNDPVPVASITSGTPHVLGIADSVFGFHPFTGESIPANKAYYVE